MVAAASWFPRPRDGGVIGMLDATNCEWGRGFSTD
jgi:hypothetical protein